MLAQLLGQHGLPSGGTALFRTVVTPQAAALHEALARRGLWTRLFSLPGPEGGPGYHAVRLGLPPDERGLQRLGAALQHQEWEVS
jgi:cobalamin biosynthesis protein CobC